MHSNNYFTFQCYLASVTNLDLLQVSNLLKNMYMFTKYKLVGENNAAIKTIIFTGKSVDISVDNAACA